MSARASYVPERGDFMWISLRPTRGHEQAGHRPALVLSPKSYNRRTGLCVLCPSTRHAKGYAFEVRVSMPDGSESIVLADQIRCVDWRARKAEFIFRVAQDVVDEAVARLEALVIAPGA
ncbi:MAG: endoribonuclease MazF [Gemmataceae bacterium]|nr:endoribonuclease MazF [Gemmataceae bacterium]